MAVRSDNEFFNLYRHGFVRVAVCTPAVRVSDPGFNAESTVALAREAARRNAVLALFPEMGLSAYSNEDLFQQDALLEGVLAALGTIIDKTKDLSMLCVVGAPLRFDTFLYNCAVVLHRGSILGIAVKSYLPNYREFYERRQFTPAGEVFSETVSLCGQSKIPFGADILFDLTTMRHFKFYIEICEDVWVPVPPSSLAALAGAPVIGPLSASNIVVGKSEYRHNLVLSQSARCIAAYLYTASGYGESTTDLAWDGHGMIYENGTLLAESERFSRDPQVIYADIDLDRIAQDRMRITSFSQNARACGEVLPKFRTVPVAVYIPATTILLARAV